MGRAARRMANGVAGRRTAESRAGDAAANGAVPGGPPGTAQPPAALSEAARQGRAPGAEGAGVPRWLQTGAAWSWRLLLLAIAVYIVARVAAVLYIVVVPCAAAILLTALLQPLAGRLRRAGLGPLGATWCTLLLAVAALAGAVFLVTSRVRAEYPTLVT